MEIIIFFFCSYLLGSIPFGLIFTNFFLKKDVRKIGSGNIGATNVLRAGNKILALLTLIFDIGKGYFVVKISFIHFPDLVYLIGLICFIGHIFPIWLRFKGGKGVAVYVGIILALSFKLALIFGATWLIVLFTFRYSSLSSILASLSLILYNLIFNDNFQNIFLILFFLIIIYRHKQNILRIKDGKETKIKF
tara:strand:- start:57 stop:632 length:576 start_codon:yes stop_codon:yes gene_type:complete